LRVDLDEIFTLENWFGFIQGGQRQKLYIYCKIWCIYRKEIKRHTHGHIWDSENVR